MLVTPSSFIVYNVILTNKFIVVHTFLKGKTETKAPVEDVWVPKSRTSDQAPKRASESAGKSPILSLGSLNLKTVS